MSNTHDYTRAKRRWGHDIHYKLIDPEGVRLQAGGWGRGIEPGHFILLSNPVNGYTTRYQVESIEYYADPADQWSGVLAFAPRLPEGTL